METQKLKSSNKYAWLLVIALGIMAGGTTGAYSVVAGNFLPAVCSDLGFEYSKLSLYFTITLIALAATLPFVDKLYPKIVGKPAFPIIVLILYIAGAAMGFYTKLWMWYVSAAVIGVCFAFTTGVCMSTIVDQWFKQKAGLAIGICWAINSIFTLIMSPIMAKVIELVGWRNGYVVLAVVSAILVLPMVIFVIKYKPEDKGMYAYGYDPNEKEVNTQSTEVVSGVSFKDAIKSPAFYTCVGFLSLVQVLACMNQFFPTFASEVGFGAMIGSLMVSVTAIVDIALNPIMGSTIDKLGVKKGLVGWILINIISFIMLIFSQTNQGLAIVAAGVNDVMYSIAGVGPTLLVMALFGSKDYSHILAWVSTIVYAVGAFGMPIMTGLYEMAGNFQTVFIVCIVLDILLAILLIASCKLGDKLKWEGEKTIKI